MKSGILVLVIGISVLVLGYAVNLIFGVTDGEFLSPLVWHIFWVGALFSGIGIILIVQNRKISTENTLED